MTVKTCESRFRWCTRFVLTVPLAVGVAVTPAMASAAQPTLYAPGVYATGLSPQAAKLRTIMNFAQDPDELDGAGEGDGDADADAATDEAPAPAPIAEGPAPAPTPDGPPPKKGLGLMISGAVITGAVGLPLTVYGILAATVLNRAGNEAGVGGAGVLAVPLIVTGILVLGAGVPMLAIGASRFSKHQKWKKAQSAFVPTVDRTAYGTWTAGVALRF